MRPPLPTRPVDLGSRGVLAPRRGGWALALLWALALFALVLLATPPLAALLAAPWPGPGAPWPLVDALAAPASVLLYAGAVGVAERRAPSEVSLRPLLPEVALGAAGGLLLFALVMGALVSAGLYEVERLGPAAPWTGLGLSLRSGVVEEVLARAVLFRLVWRAAGPWVALAASAAVFGGLHLPNPNASWFAALCIAVEAGVMLAAFYALTGRVWVSVGLHGGWNWAQGSLFGAAVSGTGFGPALARSLPDRGAPAWATGGAFGPEASLPALVLCGTVGGAALWAAWRAGRLARHPG